MDLTFKKAQKIANKALSRDYFQMWIHAPAADKQINTVHISKIARLTSNH